MTTRDLESLRRMLGDLVREEIQRALAAAQPSALPDAMTVDQAAELLGVSRDTVYEAAGRGELPHRRLGKRLIFSRRSLTAWLAGSE